MQNRSVIHSESSYLCQPGGLGGCVEEGKFGAVSFATLKRYTALPMLATFLQMVFPFAPCTLRGKQTWPQSDSFLRM